jgi:flavin-dependent dehydrogenase
MRADLSPGSPAVQQNNHYDVVIMGGGIGGNLQARHLVRTIPGIRVAMIDPRSDSKAATIHKVGESTVEIAAIFMAKDLGLVDYLIENHPPKCGLAFHWAKDPAKTDSVDDYFSIWPPRFPKVLTFQLHRGRLERDLRQMNIDDGVEFILGKVRDFDVDLSGVNTVEVKCTGADNRSLTADHIIDAASRAFLTGKKFDNIRTETEDLYGLDTFASWVRVTGVDRTIFRDGADPMKSATSHYYATNHWMGHGHWLWQIPICTKTATLSVGGMFHKSLFEEGQLDRKEKLLAFLKENHTACYDLVCSGEIVDFIQYKRPSHLCKQMFGEGNWYAIGDAAYFADAFYSFGISTIAIAVTSVTELIRAQMAGEADVEEKRQAFDAFNVHFAETTMHLYRDHDKHLGNPSAMSWRIYLEYMWWFGVWVPMFTGRWHLDTYMAKQFVANCEKGFFKKIYDDMTRMIDEGRSAGFQDCYRADQLTKDYCPTDEHIPYLEDAEFEPQRLNIYSSIRRTYWLTALWILKFEWKAFGLAGLLRPRTWGMVGRMLRKAAWIGMGSLRQRFLMRNTPSSAKFAAMMDEFEDYRFTPTIQPFSSTLDPAGAGKPSASAMSSSSPREAGEQQEAQTQA